jgi:hypothetical protein
MGLDMYLYAKEYIAGNDYITTEKDGFHSVPNPRFDAIVESFGLDRSDLEPDMPSAYVQFKVLQWRKANAIHDWFVNNVQHGEDDCGNYYVSRESLEELLATLGQVLQAREGGDDTGMIPEDILPTAQGFFFGSEEYDDYYWSEVERTYEAINALLNNHKFDNFDFEYTSSW